MHGNTICASWFNQFDVYGGAMAYEVIEGTFRADVPVSEGYTGRNLSFNGHYFAHITVGNRIRVTLGGRMAYNRFRMGEV